MLKQLVAYLGRDDLFAGIGNYFAEHRWGNATLADLLQSLEASSGRSLAEWSKAWLETAGPNTLRPAIAVDGEGRFTEFAVLQEAPAAHPELRDCGHLLSGYRPCCGSSNVRGPQPGSSPSCRRRAGSCRHRVRSSAKAIGPGDSEPCSLFAWGQQADTVGPVDAVLSPGPVQQPAALAAVLAGWPGVLERAGQGKASGA